MATYPTAPRCLWSGTTYLQTEPHTINAGKFWHHARAHGWTDRSQSRASAAPLAADRPGGWDMYSGPAAGPGDDPGMAGEGAQEQEKEEPPTFTELLAWALDAVRNADTDSEMALGAQIMGGFKRTDSQVTAALFRLLTEQESKGGQPIAASRRGVDLARCDSMVWLLPGYIPEKDQSLTYGPKGSGKILAAIRQAINLIDGVGFLGGEAPYRCCRVLFIASDSGIEPLKEAIEKSGLGDHPAITDDRFVVWAHAANQGQTAWDASLTGC